MTRNRIIIGILFIFAVISVAATIYINRYMSTPKQSPIEHDSSAISGVPNVSDELGYSEVYREGMPFSAHICGVIKPDVNNDVEVFFTNDSTNDVLLMLQVLDDNGSVIASTGTINPGEYISTIHLNSKPDSGSDIKLKICAVNPESHYSEGSVILNTTIA